MEILIILLSVGLNSLIPLVVGTLTLHYYYLRQVNERRFCFRSMCVCLPVSVRSGPVNGDQSDQFKTVKAMDFKYDTHVPMDSPDMIP